MKIDLKKGNQIRRIRDLRGMSRLELANFCGVDPKTIKNYEKGINAPGMGVLYRMSFALDVSIEDLYPQLVLLKAIVEDIRYRYEIQ